MNILFQMRLAERLGGIAVPRLHKSLAEYAPYISGTLAHRSAYSCILFSPRINHSNYLVVSVALVYYNVDKGAGPGRIVHGLRILIPAARTNEYPVSVIPAQQRRHDMRDVFRIAAVKHELPRPAYMRHLVISVLSIEPLRRRILYAETRAHESAAIIRSWAICPPAIRQANRRPQSLEKLTARVHRVL